MHYIHQTGFRAVAVWDLAGRSACGLGLAAANNRPPGVLTTESVTVALKWKRVVSVLLRFYSTMAHTGPPFFSRLHTSTAFTSVVSCFPAVPAPVLAAEVDAEAQQILFQTTTSNKSTPSSAARHFHLYNPPLKHSGSGLRLRFHFLVVTVMAR